MWSPLRPCVPVGSSNFSAMGKQGDRNPFDYTRKPRGSRNGILVIELMVLTVSVFLIGVVTGAVLALMEYEGTFPQVNSSTWIAIGTLGVAIATAATATHEALKEHRSRTPSLQLVLMESTHTRAKPTDFGGVVTVKNLGPGTARNVIVTTFAYPVGTVLTESRDEAVGPTTWSGVEERGALDAGEAWVIQAEEFTGSDVKVLPKLPPGDYYYEFLLEAETVFGSKIRPVRETLSRVRSEQDIGAGPIKVFRWKIVPEAEAMASRRKAEATWRQRAERLDSGPLRH